MDSTAIISIAGIIATVIAALGGAAIGGWINSKSAKETTQLQLDHQVRVKIS